ncbi:hypothetical protein JM78_31920 [Burkholderia pyrrocinia]|nr:hypothetical protein JM78_31920 [Burkholderia pyrrocinia]
MAKMKPAACCERIVQQERDMAARLLRHLPALTTAFFPIARPSIASMRGTAKRQRRGRPGALLAARNACPKLAAGL